MDNLDDLIGFIIFFIVVIAGLLGKLRGKGAEAPGPWEDLPSDLPEKTKELLFGRQAVEKGGAPETRSREFEQPTYPAGPEGPRPVRPAKPKTAIPPRPQAAPPPRPQYQEGPRQLASRKAKPAQVEEETGHKMRPQDLKPLAAAYAQKMAPPRAQPRKPPAAPSPVSARQKTAAPAPPGKPMRIAQILRDADNVKRAIVLSEILGPPVSLRRD